MDLASITEFIADGVLPWMQQNWLNLVLTAEIVGAVLAFKARFYRRGLIWLCAAMATIWIART